MKKPVHSLQGMCLVKFGFVHATGLPQFMECGEQSAEGYSNKPSKRHAGTWNIDRGICVIVTSAGEVWIAQQSAKDRLNGKILKKLCPRGKSDFFPCEQYFAIPEWSLARRRNNPLYDHDGIFRVKPSLVA